MASRFLKEGEDVLKKVGAGMGMTGAMITDKVGDLVNYFTGIKSPSAVETMNPVMEKIWGKKTNAPTTPNTGQPFTGSTRYGVNSQGYAVEDNKQPGVPTGKEVEKFNYGIHNYKKNPVTTNANISKRSVSPTAPAKENAGGGGNGLWTPVYDKELETRNRERQISAASDEAYANLRYASSHGASPEELVALTSAYQGSFKPATNVQEAAYKEGEVPFAGEVLKSGIGLNAARAEEARASAGLHRASAGKIGVETAGLGLENKADRQKVKDIKDLSVHTVTDELGNAKTVYDTAYGIQQYNKLHGIPEPEAKSDADIMAEAKAKILRNPSQKPRIRQYLINNGFDPKAVDSSLGL